jgi:hypothetical protein
LPAIVGGEAQRNLSVEEGVMPQVVGADRKRALR